MMLRRSFLGRLLAAVLVPVAIVCAAPARPRFVDLVEAKRAEIADQFEAMWDSIQFRAPSDETLAYYRSFPTYKGHPIEWRPFLDS